MFHRLNITQPLIVNEARKAAQPTINGTQLVTNATKTQTTQWVSLQLQHPNWQISWLQDRFDQAWLVRYRQNF